MNISSSSTQEVPVLAAASSTRVLPDGAEQAASRNLIPALKNTESNARSGGRTDRDAANEQQSAVGEPVSAEVKSEVGAVSNESARDSSVATQSAAQRARSGVAAESELTSAKRQVISELAARDREVRDHEAAHTNTGGRFTGASSFTYERGPNGRNYAVAGEVSIQVSSSAIESPQDAVERVQAVRRAA